MSGISSGAAPALVVVLAVLAAAPAGAQSDPTAPAAGSGVIGAVRNWARDTQLVGRINGEVDGWYPRLGSVTRGSGFAAGPGYRGPAGNGGPYIDVSGALSIKGYTAVDARARWLQTAGNRFQLWSDFRHEDFPQEDFFGTGMASTRDRRTSYAFGSLGLQARAVMLPRRWLRLTATTGVQWPDIGTGTDSRHPSIEQLFDDRQAPGLLAQPAFLHSTVAASIDSRDTAGNTTGGGLYRVSYGLWNDVSLDRFNFHRLDAHLVHFVPLDAGRRHIVSGRLGTSYVNNATGSRVPFYDLAYAGGMDTIRSVPEFRFQDENAAWLSVEYKWRPLRPLSLAVFADAGEVRDDWARLSRHGMKAGYGVGAGLHTSQRTMVRVDVGGGGGEGWQLFIKVRPDF